MNEADFVKHSVISINIRNCHGACEICKLNNYLVHSLKIRILLYDDKLILQHRRQPPYVLVGPLT